MRSPIFENIKPSNSVSVRVLGVFYRKYHKGSGRADFIAPQIPISDEIRSLCKLQRDYFPILYVFKSSRRYLLAYDMVFICDWGKFISGRGVR